MDHDNYAQHSSDDAERETVAKIVAWLRADPASGMSRQIADAIERGEWRGRQRLPMNPVANESLLNSLAALLRERNRATWVRACEMLRQGFDNQNVVEATKWLAKQGPT